MKTNLPPKIQPSFILRNLVRAGMLAAFFLAQESPAAPQATIDSTFTGAGNGSYEDPADWSPQQVPNNSPDTTYNVSIADYVVTATSIDAVISNLTVAAEQFGQSGLNFVDHSFTVLGNTTAIAPSQFAPQMSLNARTRSVTMDLGNLSAFSGTTLTGSYTVETDDATLTATMRFKGANVVTLASESTLGLDGPGSTITDENGNDAFRNLAFIGGLFKVAARSFTISGDLTVAENAWVSLEGQHFNTFTLGGLGASLTVHGNFTNFDATTQTLSKGLYSLKGDSGAPIILRFNGADIVNNNAFISLVGRFNGGILDEHDNDALRNFSHNLANGELFLNGRTFTVSKDFSNDGVVNVSSNRGNVPAKFVITGMFTNFHAATRTLTGGAISVDNQSAPQTPSTFQFPGADVVHNASSIFLTFNSHIVDQNGNDALRNLATNESSGSLAFFSADTTVPGDFANAGDVRIDKGHFTVAAGHTYNQSGGETALADGGTLSATTVAIAGGLFDGTGTVNGDLQVTGDATLAPTNPQFVFGSHAIAINGTLALSGDSHLRFSITGATNANDFISVSSTAGLDGTLDIAVGADFVPSASDSFTLLTAASPLSGSFKNVANGDQLKTLDGSGSFRVTYNGTSIIASNFQPAPPTARLLNISTRLRVQSGDNVLIGGFIITGTTSKKVMIRGLGPSLNGVGVILSDPTLELHHGDTTVATNDNWKTDDKTQQSQEAVINSTTIPPINDLESAIVTTLDPGAYTAILASKSGDPGVGVMEVYDLDQTGRPRLGNISTRGFVDSGDNAMIGGFIIGPADGAAATVVVRAIGPSLATFGINGALQDPTLELHDGNGATIAFNDNWQDDPSQSSIPPSLKPGDPRESALFRVLASGDYTAVVRGAGDSTGVGLVEVYNIQ
jgi:hypothetical protein